MTNEKQMTIDQSKKDWGKIIGLTVLGIITLPLIGAAIIGQAFAEYKPDPQLPLAEAQYQVAELNLCLALKQKGNARLQDDANGLITEDFDRNVTAKYRNMDCSKIKLNVSVDF